MNVASKLLGKKVRKESGMAGNNANVSLVKVGRKRH